MKFVPPLKAGPWAGHCEFAGWIVQHHRPRTIVELGVWHGCSFLSFCEAVTVFGVDCECYGVDTWEGDEHAGYYGADSTVYDGFALKAHAFKCASWFRTTFDEAATLFQPGQIDLLHIDGLHTYEAVKHDFETWLHLLSERAVVLLHDINVPENPTFGVGRFFDELKATYMTFEMPWSHGLGVVRVGPGALHELFEGDPCGLLVKFAERA